MNQKYRWILPGLLAALLVLGTSATAQAAGDTQAPLADPNSVLSRALASVLQETSNDPASINSIAGDFASDISLNPRGNSVSPSSDLLREDELSVSIDFVDDVGDPQDGLTVFKSQSADVAAYVQPLNNGVRIMSVIGSSQAPSSFDYTFDVPTDTYLQQISDETFVLLSVDGRYLGSLDAPWAVDAAGISVETGFSWDGDTLTQTIKHSAGHTFPIVADPAWRYDVDNSTVGLDYTGKAKTTVAQAMAELHRCFNCSFPILGAPGAFPQVGQIIQLNASPFSFINVPAPVVTTAVTASSWTFYAQPGHFDGANSYVQFVFYKDAQGYLHLNTKAYVMNDPGPAGQVAYTGYAKQTWGNMIANLIRQPTLPPPV